MIKCKERILYWLRLTSTGSLGPSLDNTVNMTIFLDTHVEWGSSHVPKSGVKAKLYQHS